MTTTFKVKQEFERRPLRLSRVFGTSPLYFITFCTHGRRSYLARDEIHAAFVLFVERAERDFGIAVGRYVIMPEHVHLFVRGGPNFVLGRWIGMLKQSLAKASNRSRRGTQIWQEGFFDHVLRSNESYAQKWEYVHENPVRAGARKIGLTKARSFISIVRSLAAGLWLVENERRPTGTVATNDASVLLLIPALGHSFRGDSTSVSRICANCHVHRHSGFQIGDRASLSVYSDFGKLRDRECSRCFVVAYGSCIRPDRYNDRLVICRGCGCLLFPSLTESWINHDYGQENRHDDEQPVFHDLRLKRIAGRMKQKVFFRWPF